MRERLSSPSKATGDEGGEGSAGEELASGGPAEELEAAADPSCAEGTAAAAELEAAADPILFSGFSSHHVPQFTEETAAAAEEAPAVDDPPAPPSVGKPYCGLVQGGSAVWLLCVNAIATVPFGFAAGTDLYFFASGFVAGCIDLNSEQPSKSTSVNLQP